MLNDVVPPQMNQQQQQQPMAYYNPNAAAAAAAPLQANLQQVPPPPHHHSQPPPHVLNTPAAAVPAVNGAVHPDDINVLPGMLVFYVIVILGKSYLFHSLCSVSPLLFYLFLWYELDQRFL